jgi:transketolase
MPYESTLADLAAHDGRIVVMTAENRAAIRNLPALLGGRFIDVGIAESTMIGAAAGLALRGRIPVTHALAAFLTLRAFEFIRDDVGIPNLPVKMVGGVPGVLSDGNGPTHQAIEDISLMRGIPNVNVFAPADVAELVQALPAIVEHPSPFYIRYNAAPAAIAHAPFEIGRAETIGDGDDVAIITYGFLFGEALKARRLLEAEGIAVRLINLRTVKPIDVDAVIAAAEETGLVVTLEDHFITGGLYSILGELLLKRRLTARVLPIAFENRWFTPALLDDVLVREGLTGDLIADRILQELEAEPLASPWTRGILNSQV